MFCECNQIFQYVVEFKIDDEFFVVCIIGCLVYFVLGCSYYVKFNFFKKEMIDDIMGELLI